MKKILWITNIPLEAPKGEAADKIFGGWLTSLLNIVASANKYKIYIVSPHGLMSVKHYESELAENFLIPSNRTPLHTFLQKKALIDIKNKINPDVIHIHGSEYLHSYISSKIFEDRVTFLSIQGLINEVRINYFNGINFLEFINFNNFKEFLFAKGFLFEYIKMIKSSLCEKKVYSKVNYRLGRTGWDERKTNLISKERSCYIHLDEPLRDCFYEGDEWRFQKHKKFIVYFSQGNYPLKGLHVLIRAVELLVKKGWDLEIRVAGKNPTTLIKTKVGVNFFNYYGKYIYDLIFNLGLGDRIKFLGILNSSDVKKELINCNLFISASSIENSPNSLCEAQILGVPFLASNVGGVPSLVLEDDYQYLFEKNNHGDLAFKIEKILILGSKVECCFKKYIGIARSRHSKDKILNKLIEVYDYK